MIQINQTKNIYYLLAVIFSFYLHSCMQSNASERKSIATEDNKISQKRNASEQSKKYWFDGTAEITSYTLSQARYGELHEGTATLIFVTEPFSKISNTKADRQRQDNIPVLKLNMNKKFTTGIYPYSMMNSTFFPFENENTSLKIASSIQEWCGMTYVEMKNENDLLINFNSYFEGASFKNKKIKSTILEDDLWSLLRLNPELLPEGEQNIIPSFFYLNSTHKEFKAYTATISIEKLENQNIYTIHYPKLQRTLSIQFSKDFPFTISGWKDSYNSGYGANKKVLTTEAKINKRIKVDYWNKNSNKDKEWRNKLGL
ncbi:hypothetical protein [Tenacibaculum agarivorans]|uniref:hypothetical protein n=1 Tax=Tenacibaculum agarivorans TaxID=1908389 RepID=UPI00094B8814|nr:hypothetical protein [Tenacibaculum agarivorans]